jgi:hypothetical protein
MSETQQPGDLGIEHADAYHTAAIATEATPVARDLIEYTQTAAAEAESDLDGDLETLAEELREAEKHLRELADTAHYLADRP